MTALLKFALGGALIAAATEFAKRSGKIGGLILSLPLTSIFAIMIFWLETRSAEKTASMTEETLWFIAPSLTLFVIFPFLLRRGMGFPLAFTIGILSTAASYAFLFKIRP